MRISNSPSPLFTSILIFSADYFDNEPEPSIVTGSDLPRRGREQPPSRTHMRTEPEFDSCEAKPSLGASSTFRVQSSKFWKLRNEANGRGNQPTIDGNILPDETCDRITKRTHLMNRRFQDLRSQIAGRSPVIDRRYKFFYQTNPCARSASSGVGFKVQGVRNLRNEAIRRNPRNRRKCLT